MSDHHRAGGRVIAGRYRLGRVVGRGGMGILWAAEDLRLQREVAVKEIIPPGDLTREQQELVRARALHEARAAARATHPSAITVYDVVEEEGRPWIVMQLLSPSSLADIIADTGPVPPETAARIGLDLLEALVAAHDAGVLHCDVKPGNVLFRGGRAVLVDFGVASLGDEVVALGADEILGSPAFMPPERARGERLTLASDLWSLGATLFAAVEGRAPFQRGNALATLAAVLTEGPPPALHAGALRPVLAALLAGDPADRPGAARTRRLLLEATTAPAAPQRPRDVVRAALATPALDLQVTRRLRRPVPGRGRLASFRGVAVLAAGMVAASLLLAIPTVAVIIHEVDSTAPSTAAPPASTPFPDPTQPPSARTRHPDTRTATRRIGGPASTNPPNTGRAVVTLAHFTPPRYPVHGPHGGPREGHDAGKPDAGHAKGHDKGGGKGHDKGGGKGHEKGGGKG
ncbi:MAG TPA: protein kinase [Kineosporiaceae bacterium]|nr:protein kinase [Kineosporiaceae bacterium]